MSSSTSASTSFSIASQTLLSAPGQNVSTRSLRMWPTYGTSARLPATMSSATLLTVVSTLVLIDDTSAYVGRYRLVWKGTRENCKGKEVEVNWPVGRLSYSSATRVRER